MYERNGFDLCFHIYSSWPWLVATFMKTSIASGRPYNDGISTRDPSTPQWKAIAHVFVNVLGPFPSRCSIVTANSWQIPLLQNCILFLSLQGYGWISMMESIVSQRRQVGSAGAVFLLIYAGVSWIPVGRPIACKVRIAVCWKFGKCCCHVRGRLAIVRKACKKAVY